MICWVKINGRESGTSIFFVFGGKWYIRLQKKINRGIYFFKNSLNSAVDRCLIDTFNTETTFGLLADKVGGMTFWKQILITGVPVSLPLPLFLFFLAVFLRAALHYPRNSDFGRCYLVSTCHQILSNIDRNLKPNPNSASAPKKPK